MEETICEVEIGYDERTVTEEQDEGLIRVLRKYGGCISDEHPDQNSSTMLIRMQPGQTTEELIRSLNHSQIPFLYYH